MRKAEMRKLYEKLMEFIGKKLIYLNQVEEWTDVEIAAKIGIPAPRLSEIKRYNKADGRLMSENTLVALLGGNIVTTKEIKKKVDLNPGEEKYIDGLALIQDKGIRERLQALKEKGVDLYAALDQMLEDAE